jgi:hypothetical protein
MLLLSYRNYSPQPHRIIKFPTYLDSIIYFEVISTYFASILSKTQICSTTLSHDHGLFHQIKKQLGDPNAFSNYYCQGSSLKIYCV